MPRARGHDGVNCWDFCEMKLRTDISECNEHKNKMFAILWMLKYTNEIRLKYPKNSVNLGNVSKIDIFSTDDISAYGVVASG